jgi:hypothetical protein
LKTIPKIHAKKKRKNPSSFSKARLNFLDPLASCDPVKGTEVVHPARAFRLRHHQLQKEKKRKKGTQMNGSVTKVQMRELIEALATEYCSENTKNRGMN